jgi:hypothetical protein
VKILIGVFFIELTCANTPQVLVPAVEIARMMEIWAIFSGFSPTIGRNYAMIYWDHHFLAKKMKKSASTNL